MMLEKINTLPEKNILSPYLIGKSTHWFYVLHFGRSYIIPVDKEMKKVIDRIGIFKFKDIVNDIIGAIYLQVRRRIGDDTETMLSQQIDDGFRKLYSDNLRKKIEEKFNLLEYEDKKVK